MKYEDNVNFLAAAFESSHLGSIDEPLVTARVRTCSGIILGLRGWVTNNDVTMAAVSQLEEHAIVTVSGYRSALAGNVITRA